MVGGWLASDAVPGKVLNSTLRRTLAWFPIASDTSFLLTVGVMGVKYGSLTEKRLRNTVVVKPLCKSQGHSGARVWLGLSPGKSLLVQEEQSLRLKQV